VDTRRFDPRFRSEALRQQWGLAGDGLAIIHVGRLAPEKNLPLLLHCFERLRAERPGSRLVLVGDGPARAALAQQHPEIIFTGTLRGEALATHFASADCSASPASPRPSAT
jgi:glycosyltransferase involved in cell wall biosynthesis